MSETHTRYRIAFDIDDVLWDLNKCWLDEYNLYNTNGEHFSSEQVKSWNIENCLKPQNPNLFWAILSNKGTWSAIDKYIYNNTKKLLKQLHTNPHIDLYIVTASHPNNLTYKLPAFFRNFPFINWKQLIICQDKTMLDMDLWIDDKPELMEKLHALGKKCAMVSKPWNENCKAADWIFGADFGIKEWKEMEVSI